MASSRAISSFISLDGKRGTRGGKVSQHLEQTGWSKCLPSLQHTFFFLNSSPRPQRQQRQRHLLSPFQECAHSSPCRGSPAVPHSNTPDLSKTRLTHCVPPTVSPPAAALVQIWWGEKVATKMHANAWPHLRTYSAECLVLSVLAASSFFLFSFYHSRRWKSCKVQSFNQKPEKMCKPIMLCRATC